MNTPVNGTALLALQWWIRLALAWSEMLACVVFLIPRTMKAGALLLIIVLALAALVHALHGNFQIGGLLIFAAAVAVVASQSHS
jgi:hypothetical protein